MDTAHTLALRSGNAFTGEALLCGSFALVALSQAHSSPLLLSLLRQSSKPSHSRKVSQDVCR
jgi:hypothetical protein